MRKFFKSFTSREKSTDLTKLETFTKSLNDVYSLSTDKDIAEKLPQLLNFIIQLLLEEDKEYEYSETSPCIEHFLNNRVMEKLCKIAENNTPKGVYQLIINAISRIIQHMKPSLLGHYSIHKPLVDLLSKKQNKISFIKEVELLKLINSITIKLKESPMLTRLFWSIKPDKTDSNGIVIEQSIKDFVLWKKLDRLYRGTNDKRLLEQVRRTILKSIIIDDGCEDMQEYLSRQHKFMAKTVNELHSLFNSLLKDSANYTNFQEYVKYVHFCNELCKIEFTTSVDFPMEERFSQKLIQQISKQFFDEVLILGLVSDDSKISSIYSLYITETLNQIDAPKLSQPFLLSIIEPEVFSKILSRIENSNVDDIILQVNTLNLIIMMISLHNHTIDIVDRILFDNFSVCVHKDAMTGFGKNVEMFMKQIHHLNLDDNSLNQDIITYCEHFRSKIRVNRKFLVGWHDPQAPHIEGKTTELKEKSLLMILIKKFERYFENSIDLNLAITDILTTIAQYPHKMIQKWCLSTKGEYSLSHVFNKLSNDIKTAVDKDKPILNIIKVIRHEIEIENYPNLDIQDIDEQERISQLILILNEFLKEFVASLIVTNEFLQL